MRTGIYVQKPTKVTVRASAPQDAHVRLLRFRLQTCETDARAQLREPDAVGTHELDAGIYLIVSSSPMQVEGDNLTTKIVPNNKDPWPDPELTVGLVPGATPQAIQEFFSVAKGIEVVDPPAPPDDDTTESAGEGDDD